MMNCPDNLGRDLMNYKNGLRGYEPLHFNLRWYTDSGLASDLPYIYAQNSFLPCSSRRTQQWNECDYNTDKIDYDVNNPILFAPLPYHNFSSAGIIVKYSAGFTGISNLSETDGTATFRLRLLRVNDGISEITGEKYTFNPLVVNNENGYSADAVDPASYSHVAGTYARQTIPANTRTWIDLNVSAFTIISGDDLEQYFVAPSISLAQGIKCATAYLDVEIFHDKI